MKRAEGAVSYSFPPFSPLPGLRRTSSEVSYIPTIRSTSATVIPTPGTSESIPYRRGNPPPLVPFPRTDPDPFSLPPSLSACRS